jgi:preprotein translocase subunit Sss1
MELAFKASLVVIVVVAVIGFLGYIIEKNLDRQSFN